MKREEFIGHAMEMLSKLMPEQRQRLLDQLEAHLWMMNHLGMWAEKRTGPPNRIMTQTRVRHQGKTRSNHHKSLLAYGRFT